MRAPISAEERLAVTLRYLATGESQRSLAYSFRLGRATISNIIGHTCTAIWDIMSPKVLPSPSGKVFKKCADRFWDLWDFPNCIGAVDGKHIRIKCPKKSGSEFFNYKKFFSIVLLGIADADYRFLVVDIGAPGRLGDSSVFPNTNFGRSFNAGEIELPEKTALPGTTLLMPHVFIGDDAFPLKTNFMKPYGGNDLTYEQRVFNYRLSRARRIIENAFGIMVARWRILKTEMNCSEPNARRVVKAVCCLHNFLQTESLRLRELAYCPPGFVDSEDPITHGVIPGQWRQIDVAEEAKKKRGRGANNFTQQAAVVRDTFATYFNSQPGHVPWQHFMVTTTAYNPVS